MNNKKGEPAYETIIDTEDLNLIKGYRWTLDGRGYVIGSKRNSKGEKERIPLHRLVMNAPRNKEVDHQLHNKLDNRKSQLRLSTHAENLRNQKGLQAHNKSGFYGVYLNNNSKRWVAKIKVDGEEIYLGSFKNAEIASRHYDVASIKYHKEFGFLNHDRSDYCDENGKPDPQKMHYYSRKEQERGDSKYIGVHFDKEFQRWVANIAINKKSKRIGRYKTEEAAARSYDMAVIEHRDENAYTNFMRSDYLNPDGTLKSPNEINSNTDTTEPKQLTIDTEGKDQASDEQKKTRRTN